MTRIYHRLFLWKWIPCQFVTSILCLLFCLKTVHCSTKNAFTSEITFLALVPWSRYKIFYSKVYGYITLIYFILCKVSVASEMIKLGFSPKYIFVLQSENSLTSDSPGKYLFHRSCKINNKKYKNCSFTQ